MKCLTSQITSDDDGFNLRLQTMTITSYENFPLQFTLFHCQHDKVRKKLHLQFCYNATSFPNSQRK